VRIGGNDIVAGGGCDGPCILGCRTYTYTGTSEPVPGPPDPVVGNARWRPRWDRKVAKQNSNKVLFLTAIYMHKYIHMRLENQATGTAHVRLPFGDYGP
jgi:hypothetical protein